MNENIKKRWVEALRSGKYKQGHGALWNPRTDRFCCLGVLCEIARQDGLLQPGKFGGFVEDDSGYEYDAYVPIPVRMWAGLDECDPHVIYDKGESENWYVTLSQLNDTLNLNFSEIADLIERNL